MTSAPPKVFAVAFLTEGTGVGTWEIKVLARAVRLSGVSGTHPKAGGVSLVLPLKPVKNRYQLKDRQRKTNRQTRTTLLPTGLVWFELSKGFLHAPAQFKKPLEE